MKSLMLAGGKPIGTMGVTDAANGRACRAKSIDEWMDSLWKDLASIVIEDPFGKLGSGNVMMRREIGFIVCLSRTQSTDVLDATFACYELSMHVALNQVAWLESHLRQA